MKKLSLAVVGLYIGLLAAFSQPATDSIYKKKKLKLDEINFVAGYYNQDGNRSPVTGGTGTEKLSDIATTFELKLSKYSKEKIKHTAHIELGIDHYTSASSDKIDPNTISSASHADTRIYPSASYSIENEKKGNEINFNASFSTEYDYTSFGSGIGFTKTSKDKNKAFTLKLQTYLDKLKIILPIELRFAGSESKPSAVRNSFSSSFIYSQSVNQRLQLALLLDLIYQEGYLSTPFHRIYFNNGSETNEKLPSSRFKIPAALRLNYFIGDKFIIRSYYRYYSDDWGLKANTFNIETPIKLTSFFSISPFYRFYSQTDVKYFSAYMSHSPSENFYTTDDDLSQFNSHFFGTGIRFTPPGGVLHFKHFNTLELRYGYYKCTHGLNSNIISLSFKYK